MPRSLAVELTDTELMFQDADLVPASLLNFRAADGYFGCVQ